MKTGKKLQSIHSKRHYKSKFSQVPESKNIEAEISKVVSKAFAELLQNLKETPALIVESRGINDQDEKLAMEISSWLFKGE